MTTTPPYRPDDDSRDIPQRDTAPQDLPESQVDESQSLRNRLSLDDDRTREIHRDSPRVSSTTEDDHTRVMPTRDGDSTQVMHAPTSGAASAGAASTDAHAFDGPGRDMRGHDVRDYDARDYDVQRLDRVNDDGKGPHQRDIIRSGPARFTLALLRIGMGFYFLWAFFDKLLGLGYATPEERAWVNGGSPTRGFLSNANPDGPLAGTFRDMAGQTWVDWLFMIGLAGIGVALVLGLATRFASFMGLLLVTMMYLAVWPVGHSVAWAAAGEGRSAHPNPFVDSHIVEALVFLVLMTTYAGDYLGLGKAWRKVVGNSILR